jgi:hypothetical protein
MRWRQITLIAACALIACVALGSAWGVHVQHARAASYQAALESYSANLKIGTSRNAVENYLQSRSVNFNREGAESDQILIGDEGSDLVCAKKLEYLDFYFTPAQRGEAWKANDADTLTRIALRFYGECP